MEHLSEADKRAYILADNRLAEDAGWDEEMLAIELQGLIDLDVSIELTGFELSEVDQIIERQGRGQALSQDPADELTPVATDIPAVTQPGDLWKLGSHRLLYGDATQAGSYQALLDGERASLIFTDPRYNVPIVGHVSGLGKAKHQEFAMASGEMSRADFTAFLATVFGHMAD